MKRPFIADIIRHTANVFGVTIDEIKGRSRRRYILRARQAAVFLAFELSGQSSPAIGRSFGGRDHSTILHTCKVVPEFAKREERFAKNIEMVRRLIARQGKAFKVEMWAGKDLPPEPEPEEPAKPYVDPDPEPEHDTDEWFSWAIRNGKVREAA